MVFVGKVVDLVEKGKHFAISNLHLFPSTYDTDGIVRIEAAAFSVPTVFVNTSLPATAIDDGVNGYISQNTPEAFAQRIEEIFADEKTYAKVQQNCKKDLYITWDEVVPQAFEKYKELCNKAQENK